MARGSLKSLKRNRPAQGVGGRTPAQGSGGTLQQHGGVAGQNSAADLDGGDLVSWLNCECFFSLVLVGLLAALPFNLHTQELMQTPETYIARADELSGEGAWDKAVTLYERAVTTEETAERHVFLADALVQLERKGEAIWHYGRAAKLYLDNEEKKVSTLMTMGRVETEEGRTGDAVETYLEVLDLQSGQDDMEHADAHFQVAKSLLENRNHSRALAHLEMATELDPTFAEAHELLAHTLRDMGWVEDAVTLYQAIIAQHPTDIPTLVQLGFGYQEICEFSRALDTYKKAHSSPPKAAEMEYLSAALHGQNFRPSRAPSTYVADLFDLEARKAAYLQNEGAMGGAVAGTGAGAGAGASRHVSSGRLRAMEDPDRGHRATPGRAMFYDVHGLIFDRVAINIRTMIEGALGLRAPPGGGGGGNTDWARAQDQNLQWLDVLDLGCGRGRMGEELRALANQMTGVDLSEEALKHALRLGTYDHIRHGDALAFIKGLPPQSVDVVVASDMMPYFGDLTEILGTIATVVRAGGLVAFNTDMVDDDTEDPTSFRRPSSASGEGKGGETVGYELRFTGRWSHWRRYVSQTVSAAGLTIVGVRAVKGRSPLVGVGPGEIVLEKSPQERKTFVYLLQAQGPPPHLG